MTDKKVADLGALLQIGRKTKEVEIPESDGMVLYVRRCTLGEGEQYSREVGELLKEENKDKPYSFKARLVTLYLAKDAGGERMFTDTDFTEGKVQALATDLVDLIVKEGQEFNAVSKEEVEEIAKNSEETPDDASSAS